MANEAFSLVRPAELVRKIAVEVTAGRASFSDDVKIYFQMGNLRIFQNRQGIFMPLKFPTNRGPIQACGEF